MRMRRVSAVAAALALLVLLPGGAIAAAPTNDLPAGAATISGIPGTVTQDTREATATAAEDIGCGSGGQDQAMVWYRITPSADIDVTIDVRGSGYQVGVNIFAGTATADAFVTCFDTVGFAALEGGTTYFVMFADIDGGANGGDLVADLTVAQPALDVHVTVDGAGKVLQKPGIATISGTITCDREADFAFIDLEVSQRVGKYVIRGFGFVDTSCGPTPTRWTTEAFGDNGRFAGGKATVAWTATACQLGRCPIVQGTSSVQLRRGGSAKAPAAAGTSGPTALVAAVPPSNDASSTPRAVGPLPYTDGPYDTTGATAVATDPGFCFDPAAGPDPATVWYSFTPSVSDEYLATTFGSDYDTTLYVGTANGAGGIEVIDCVDDVNGLQSAVQWTGAAGTTYLIAVGTCCGAGIGATGGGNLRFSVDVAPPAPALELVVSPTGTITRYGQVTIRGTVTCANADPAFVDLSAVQVNGRFILRGFGFAEGIVCDGTPQAWSIDLVSQESKPFKGARIDVEVFSAACGEIFCAEEFVSPATVKLRR